MNLAAILDAAEARLTIDARHVYRLDGKHIPGVTTIKDAANKPALNRWSVNVQQDADIAAAFEMIHDQAEDIPGSRTAFAAMFMARAGKEKEGQKIARETADVGSQVHALAEQHLKGMLGIPWKPEIPITDHAQGIFSTAWLPWAKDTKLKPLAVERRVFHEAHGYAGTLDLAANAEGVDAVFDWKSKEPEQMGKLYADPVWQSIAYRRALESLTGQPWAGRVVHFCRDGSAGVVVHKIEGNGNWSEDDAFDAFLACLRIYKFDRAFERK